ncbi:MAG: right-handed parallel beta-helix repeat-containing protein [Anaerolineales bacterium]|nr:right-handed parallel beta-helix repeat-containing protein [Anaerolineales bacterium]
MKRRFAWILLIVLMTACGGTPASQSITATTPPTSATLLTETPAPTELSQKVTVAASCSAEDVQQAFNMAPDGSVVEIPAGDCDWGDAHVTRNVNITVRGAGADLTIIRRTAPVANDDISNFLIEFNCEFGGSLDISNMSLVGNDDLQTEEERLNDRDNGLGLTGPCQDFRIHDMTFEKFSSAGVTLRGLEQRGVIYNNKFISNYKCQPEPVSCLGYGVDVSGDGTSPALELGSENAVFIEDNYFYDNRHGVASGYGSRYVVRYNTFVSTSRTRDFGMIDAHGKTIYGDGSRSWEIYNNTLRTNPADMTADGIVPRGGDGVIFNNDLGLIPYVVFLSEENDCTSAYPSEGQIRSAYIWDNIWKPLPDYDQNPVWVLPGCENHMVEGRDWFFGIKPEGYEPYPYPHPLRGE